MPEPKAIQAIHVIPINDLIEHEDSDDCVCGPRFELILKRDRTLRWLITHHSLDGREHNEQDEEAHA